MKLLRIVTFFNAKKGFDIGRQTNFLELVDLESGKKLEILLKGKNAKKITIEIVDSEYLDPKNARIIEEGDDK